MLGRLGIKPAGRDAVECSAEGRAIRAMLMPKFLMTLASEETQ